VSEAGFSQKIGFSSRSAGHDQVCMRFGGRGDHDRLDTVVLDQLERIDDSVGAEAIGKGRSSVGTRIRHHRQPGAGHPLSEYLGM
jgi:hypothetical protein